MHMCPIALFWEIMSSSMGMMKLEMTMKFSTGSGETGGRPVFSASHSDLREAGEEQGQEKGEVVKAGASAGLLRKGLLSRFQPDPLA
jgi:hypothetical protein